MNLMLVDKVHCSCYLGFKILIQVPNIAFAIYFCNQKRTMDSQCWHKDKEKWIFVICAFENTMLVDKEKRILLAIVACHVFKQPCLIMLIPFELSNIIVWPSPSVSIFFPISEFSYFVIRFLNHIFLSLTFPISLSDFTIELLSKNVIMK